MKSKGKKKISPRKIVSSKKRIRGSAKNGTLYVVAIVAVVSTFGAVMAGGALPDVVKLKTPPPPGAAYTCCDSGDGAACKPIADKSISYNSQTYGLLKSNIVAGEVSHLVPTDQYTASGQRIFINNSDTTSDYSGRIAGCEAGKDLIRIYPPGGNPPCYGVANDAMIYVCTDTAAACSQQINEKKTPFDVYYRMSDFVAAGNTVPDQIASDCPKPTGSLNATSQQVINVADPKGRQNLQLETFQVLQKQQPYTFDSPWCKPAINLYPTKLTDVHVEVAPEGKLNYTDPKYPASGWDVQAYPDGAILSNNKSYPYLYWEAAMPDSLISQPKDGYSVAYADLNSFFHNLLPQMGLNDRETTQFTDYWVKALPKSNYYFVGVIPQNQIDTLAPLNISPKPDSILRVSLYFKALDQQMSVNAPQLSSFDRKGFTVTEWGGFFKADKNHPNFTCMM